VNLSEVNRINTNTTRFDDAKKLKEMRENRYKVSDRHPQTKDRHETRVVGCMVVEKVPTLRQSVSNLANQSINQSFNHSIIQSLNINHQIK
jgi:hypothetical protein